MQFSERFLSVVDEQLSIFESDAEIETVVAYVATTNDEDSPALEVIGQRPRKTTNVLEPILDDPGLMLPSSNRRWYPLQEGSILLGVLRVERIPTENRWSESLDQRLKGSATLLANCLSLELEREKLINQLSQQRDQIGILVHQLRNPLAALRTYAQLLLRKLDPDSNKRSLVEGLLSEQKQLDKYLGALDNIVQPRLSPKIIPPARLLLPPLLPSNAPLDILKLLSPLMARAEATAKLQGREWVGPVKLPRWIKTERPSKEGFVAEVIANLLENAFRYSPKKSSVGICFNDKGICVWDSGVPIDIDQRENIFKSGFRGDRSKEYKGSGIGLSLAKQLTEKFDGELYFIDNPSLFDESLPKLGNAFVIEFSAI